MAKWTYICEFPGSSFILLFLQCCKASGTLQLGADDAVLLRNMSMSRSCCAISAPVHMGIATQKLTYREDSSFVRSQAKVFKKQAEIGLHSKICPGKAWRAVELLI